jgi:uncharacterized membrane protein YcjF (UPF0283 family)
MSVGVSTALSPSARADTLVIIYNNYRMTVRVAKIYGSRPDGLAAYFLFRRAMANALFGGTSEVARKMLQHLYGSAVAHIVSEGAESFGEYLQKTGVAASTVDYGTGIGFGLQGVGYIMKLAKGVIGGTAALVSGPLLQGTINAAFATRLGLAVQAECRPMSMTAAERRKYGAQLKFLDLLRRRKRRRPKTEGGGSSHGDAVS